jgi:LacI family transcriptional regulator
MSTHEDRFRSERETFGKEIERLRIARGWTQATLAAAAGLTRIPKRTGKAASKDPVPAADVVSRLEHGYVVAPNRVQAIVEALALDDPPLSQRTLRRLADLYLLSDRIRTYEYDRAGSGIIGVLLSSIDYSTFWGRVAGAIEEQAEESRNRVVLSQHRNKIRNYFNDLYFFEELQGLTGLIVSPAYGDKPYGTPPYTRAEEKDHRTILELFRKRGVPVVFIERQVPLPASVSATVPFLGIDNQQAAHLAVDYLRKHKHRQIGALFDLPHLLTPQRERKEGFKKAMGEDYREEWVGDTDDPNYMGREEGRHKGREKANELLSRADPPTAIFCATYHLTLDVVRVAKDRGMRIPRDLSVVGFDNLIELEIAGPGITSVYYDLERLGRDAVHKVIALRERPEEALAARWPPLRCSLREGKSVVAPRARASYPTVNTPPRSPR